MVSKKVFDQPIANIVWRSATDLQSNDYNPNNVAPTELRLLKRSLLSDGWTQPIVITEEQEIIDGFHRWSLASNDSEVSQMTDGLVPTVTLTKSRAERIISTIRHNRARGKHYVAQMAECTLELSTEHDLTPDDLITHVGMDQEEVERLLDRGDMIKRGSADQLGSAWTPGYNNKKEPSHG